MSTTFLHVTSNLGSLFEEQIIEDRWYSDLNQLILDRTPGLVAIHCQEIGGKDFEANMPKVDEFIQNLKSLPCFVDYKRIRMYVDTGYTDSNCFTALGCFYFIHESVKAVSLWNFNTNKFEEVVGEKIFTETANNKQYSLLSTDRYHFKDRFPNDYFPTVRWSRKGFLHTKWRINSLVVNLVNIHLFHDEDNLVALEQSPSVYSQYRQKALHHTLQHLSKMSSGVTLEDNILFGDFNFRLNLSSVVKHLMSSDCLPQFIRGEDGGLVKVYYRSGLVSDKDDTLAIERRKFFLNSHAEIFKKKFEELLQFDNEMKKFEELREFPIAFPPSYPFSEDISKGDDYMEKRCPAWCDRILLNKSAMDAISKSPFSTTYDMLSRNICVGDHKPIYLCYTIDTELNDTSTAPTVSTSTSVTRATVTPMIPPAAACMLISSLLLPPNDTSNAVGFDPSAITPENMHGIPAGLAYYTGAVDPSKGSTGEKMGGSSTKDGKKEKKGRATFSGNQIDELEKIFATNQYLTNQERHNLAERLQLSENQVKIWFQNRRTKCRRTSWKRTPSVTSPTTPTAPVSFPTSDITPTTPTQLNTPPVSLPAPAVPSSSSN